MKFTAIAVDDPKWEQSCDRSNNHIFIDGAHCSSNAYLNLTSIANVNLDQLIKNPLVNVLDEN